MSSELAKYGNFEAYATFQHYCDTYADLAKIDPSEINLGSVAIVIEGESGGLEVYIAKSNKEWVLMGASSNEEEEEPPEGH